MPLFLEIIFWSIIFIVIYTFFVYPIILYILSKISNNYGFSGKENNSFNPEVALVISAYNEENIIREKIINSLNITYENLKIVIASDGSTDNTAKICNEFEEQISLYNYSVNEGKNATLNKVLNNIDSEIVVFSDANTFYKKDAIKKMVNNYQNKEVGCVIGQLKLTQTNSTNTSKGEGLYWKYEHFLKKLESKIGEVLVGNGGIFSARRKLLQNLIDDIPNDFQIPMDIGYQGYKIIYEPKAIGLEKTSAHYLEEMKRKIRIVNRNFNGFVKYFKKIRGIRIFEMISHKVIRWFIGFLAILIFILNIFLIQQPIYLTIFLVQIIFYGLAILAFVLPKKYKIFYIPYYITLIFVSSSIGILEFALGKNYSKWTPPETSR
ncbi:MAG: glycosyltransferase family 2 protein [Candidatus Marinimicrobia bacterium]|nr:glycosyltransferase family 2 protein [Candidatus Neomarinimicrobiota bacterium]